MKKIILGTLLIGSSLLQAQVDTKQVNERQTEEVFGELRSSKFEKSKAKKLVRAKNKLLTCVRTIVQDYHGGYEAPEIAAQVLSRGLDSDAKLINNLSELGFVLDECQTVSHELYTFRKKDIIKENYKKAIMDLPSVSVKESKIKDLLLNMYFKDILSCSVVSVGASAFGIVGGGAGVSGSKCFRSDGRDLLFLGLEIKYGTGFGAALQFRRSSLSHNGSLNAYDHLILYSQGSLDDFGTEIVAPVGPFTYDDGFVSDGRFEIGLSTYSAKIQGLAGRVFSKNALNYFRAIHQI